MAPAASVADTTRPRPIRAWAVLVAVLAFFAHAQSINHGWVNWDDTTYIHNNPLVNPEFSRATSQPVYSPWEGLRRMYTTLELPQYYPVTFHTFWNEYQLWGLRPSGYHAVNVILHAISAGLVVVLMRRLGASDGVAAAVGLLFAVAAVQVMSVAWVSERKNVLSTNWALLTMLAWGRYCERGSLKWMAATLAFFAVTLLAKSAWLGLPIVLLVQALAVHRVSARKVIPALLLTLPMSIASGWVTSAVEQGYLDTDTPLLGERLLLVPAAIVHYVLRTVLPWELTPFYPKWAVSTASLLFIVPLVACLSAAAAWWSLRRRIAPIQHWGLMLFFVSIGPVVGVLPFGNMSVTWVSDHFVYYAAIGLFAFLAVSVRDALQSRLGRAGTIAGATLCGMVLVLNIVQMQRLIPIWKNSHSLWGYVIATQPSNALGYFGRGQAYLAQGDLARAAEDYRRGLELRPSMSDFRLARASVLAQMQRLDDAKAEYQKTIELDPANRFAREQLAGLEFHQGVQLAGERKLDEAIAAYERAIALNGSFAPYWNNLGCAYLDLGKFDMAIEKIGRAVQIDPGDAPAWNNLAIAQDQIGKRDEAAISLQTAVKARPDYAAAHDRLASLYARLGKYADAIQQLRTGISAVSDERDKLALRHGLARVLASCPDAAIRSGEEAAELASAVIEATQRQVPETFDTLAMALAAQGRFDDAVRTASTALEMFRSAGNQAAAADVEHRIQRYRTGKRVDEP